MQNDRVLVDYKSEEVRIPNTTFVKNYIITKTFIVPKSYAFPISYELEKQEIIFKEYKYNTAMALAGCLYNTVKTNMANVANPFLVWEVRYNNVVDHEMVGLNKIPLYGVSVAYDVFVPKDYDNVVPIIEQGADIDCANVVYLPGYCSGYTKEYTLPVNAHPGKLEFFKNIPPYFKAPKNWQGKDFKMAKIGARYNFRNEQDAQNFFNEMVRQRALGMYALKGSLER